jgi:glutathione S-transferase
VAWLSTTANEVALGPNRLRLHYKFGRAINVDESKQITDNLLNILQGQLERQPWLATNQITIADIAVYPYIALAPEGEIDLSLYPAVTNWLSRIQDLPGYIGMPNMWQS